jgi:hypothetical protein
MEIRTPKRLRVVGRSVLSVLIDVGTNPFGVHDPTLVDRSLNGSVVGFSFPASDEFAPGQTTPQLVIETNALQYADGFASAQDGTAGLWGSVVPFGDSRALVVVPVRNRLDSRPSDFAQGAFGKVAAARNGRTRPRQTRLDLRLSFQRSRTNGKGGY